MTLAAFSRDELTRIAVASGFYKVRVASLPLPETWRDAFCQWIGSGNHADMDWLSSDIDRRFSGESVLPGAQSVVVLAAPNYPRKTETPPHPGPEELGVADFALGDDYHFVLRDKARAVAEYLEQVFPGDVMRVCTDSAPFAERTAAVVCGMGSIGRNSMVIDSESVHGSRFFLVCILTTARVSPDSSSISKDICGDCRLCVDACPGGALQWGHPFDARRCISWMTIEKREALTEGEQKIAGNRLFGCDVCQNVCPYNRQPVLTPFERLREGVRLSSTIPEEMFATCGGMTRGEFRRRFAGNSLWRAGLKRLRARADYVQSLHKP